MKLEVQFGREGDFEVPIRRTIPSEARWLQRIWTRLRKLRIDRVIEANPA